jgi:replicative DNA helicase
MTRTLRHHADAEASVLGGIILRNDVLSELDTLETEDFYLHQHKVVFEAMRNLETAQQPIDVVTLDAEIAKRGKSDSVGGIAFLGELALRVPTVDNVIAYAGLVKKAAQVRKLTLAASEITERCYDTEADGDELLGEGIQLLSSIDSVRTDSGAPVGEFVKRRIRELEDQWERRARGEQIWSGSPTGVKSLDKRISGYPFGDVAIICGRPGMGKSALALAASEASADEGFGVHVFAPEGGWRMYADRLISRKSNVSIEKLRNGDITPNETGSVSHALMRYALRPYWRLDDAGGLTATEIVRSVRKWKRKNKTRLVIVDYLQILKRRDGASENEAIEEIVNVFGQAAPNDDIAWVLVSQLNRDVEKRPDKRPMMADLRGSGALEQVARLVVSPYRGSYYYDEPKRDIDFECNECSSERRCPHGPDVNTFQKQAQVLILKNNNGEPGRVFASWNGPTTEIW